MHIEYHKWFSPHLDHEIELKVYGEKGKPFLVFPSQGGRFYEYEDFGMVGSVAHYIEKGILQLITVDSIDNQSWANWSALPADRAKRHEDYDRYIMQEVVPFIHTQNARNSKIGITGCSMGAYHATNFFFRHPDHFDTLIALSGLFRLNIFIGDYMDDTVYYNTPLAYLRNLEDPWYIEKYRKSQIIVCTGQGAWEDQMVDDALALKEILESKEIPHWIDFWGHDVNHDWPWWQKMMPYYVDKLELDHPRNNNSE